MVKSSTENLDQVFSALGDPTRRQILVALAEGERSVTELAEPFDVTLPAISKHLGVLERAGLITREREGRVRRCKLEPGPLAGATSYIRRVGSSE